jgi:cytidylate kinase
MAPFFWCFQQAIFRLLPMSSTLYLPRKISSNDVAYTEDELLVTSNYVVVLAEPGGGKTELMRSLARKLGTSNVTANKFKRMGTDSDNSPLVIDAFDELAKIDQTGIHDLLANASKAKPTHVIISSRSSEWGTAATRAFEEYFGCSPLLVRLVEFEEKEQQEIFHHHVQGEDFATFQAEVSRFDLEALLPNPQFLKMFADAYIESGRHFTDKRSIFSQAVERLAKEANDTVAKTGHTLSIAQKVDLSSEVFAKLLLSGADGIGTSEATADRIYPLLASLFENTTATEGILATRLFKPGDSADQHRPVHKIVAEYCAADYLAKRIADPTDHLTTHKCLPIIAPNATVRDELRGLLGWLAALGNKSIQESAIELDPYAVLANGDPSQLEQSSKRLLIRRLKDVETRDPYFRRGDSWRRFSAVGFFTRDVMSEIKPLLTFGNDGHLRDLILELLAGSPAIAHLTDELRELVLDESESEHTRLLASRCLLDLIGHDHRADVAVLVAEASNTSLKIVADIIKTIDPEKFDISFLYNFFYACTKLYPASEDRLERTVGTRYFIRKFVESLDLKFITPLLDELSKGVNCICGKENYACYCRDGMCKIIGLVLDRYFELSSAPFDPERIWHWLENLNFHHQQTASHSASVKVLQNNDSLRQGIMAHVFGTITDRAKIFKIKIEKFEFHSHSGLQFQSKDYDFIVDLAFELENPALWANFIAIHQRYRYKTELGSNRLRRRMREHALEKPQFMVEWVSSNRAYSQLSKSNRLPRLNRKAKRRKRQRNDRRASNIQYYQTNRALIESGCDWQSLVHFAELVLMNPDRIDERVGDAALVSTALKNCIDFIAPRIPDLLEFAQLQCSGKILHAEMVLLAACLEIMRTDGSLEDVDLRLLIALRTSVERSYSSVIEEEHNALKYELDRLIFADPSSPERYLRQYLEPQLAQRSCSRSDIWLLHGDEIFSHLRAELSIEWLERFSELDIDTLETLFETAAQFGDRSDLQKVIAERCVNIMSHWPEQTDDEYIERKRIFWLVREFYFIKDISGPYWNWLKSDRNIVFSLNIRSGRFSHGKDSYWPILTANKVEAILDAFIDEWPKVHLPSHWGTESPSEEVAYRFLTDIVWLIHSDDTREAALVLNRLLSDARFIDMHNDFKSLLATKVRQQALRDFEPPSPQDVIELLDRDTVVNVEGLRKLVLQEFQDFQKAIDGGEFNPADRFYNGGKRLGEVKATEVIAERLSLRLEAQGIVITSEHQMKSENRTDFTATKIIGGKRRLLVVEVKGQWHKELYRAASAQLYDRYSIHPDAEQQGIYLVIWFGGDELVANKKNTTLNSASELKSSIEETLPPELVGLIDVFVLDVSES